MVESGISAADAARRTRSPGVQYPGASIPQVLDLLKIVDELGGQATVGRLAAKLDKSEDNAGFKRLIISARGYGLAEWTNAEKTVLGLTGDGRLALTPERHEVLRRALLTPEVFRNIGRRFAGRTIPEAAELAESFAIAGVASAGTMLAAANFLASAEAAGVLEQEGSKKLLAADLPFPADDEEPRPVVREVRRIPAKLPAPAPAARPASVPVATYVPRVAAPTPAPSPQVTVGSGVHINIEIHIAADATSAVIEEVFKNMRRYVLDGAAADVE